MNHKLFLEDLSVYLNFLFSQKSYDQKILEVQQSFGYGFCHLKNLCWKSFSVSIKT